MGVNLNTSPAAATDVALMRLLKDLTGLDLPLAAVERAVRERMQKNRCAARADYAPQPGTPEFDALIELVVVPESWMLRDPAVLDEALRVVQRRLLTHPGQQVRILSLPCAGGEEPYSMALALARAGIGPQHCRIDAMDLSHAAVERARAGRYTRNAFRGTDAAFRARHFSEDGDEFVIGAAPRSYVSFEQGNLFALDTTARAGRYHIVFCRNLLIYFDAPTQAAAAARLYTMLTPDGLLMSGYAEAPAFCQYGFAPRSLRDTFALRKVERGGAAAGSLPWLRALGVARAAAAAPVAAPLTPSPRLPARHVFLSAASAAVTTPVPAAVAPQERLAAARRHADSGRLDDAEQACRDVLKAHPDNADAWFLLGMVDESAGRTRAAERHWRSCVYLDPDHYEALCALALLHEGRGDAALGASYRERGARVFRRRGLADA